MKLKEMFGTILPSLLFLIAIIGAPFIVRYLVAQERGHEQLSQRGEEGVKLYLLVLVSLGFQLATIGVSLILLGITDDSWLLAKMGFGLGAGGWVMLYIAMMGYPGRHSKGSRLKKLWSGEDPRIRGARRMNAIFMGLIFMICASATATSILMLGSPVYALLPAFSYGAAWALCVWPRRLPEV
jgi:hypothetical protein